MRWFHSVSLAVAALLMLQSCDDKPAHPDTLSKGTIDISVDETFKPIIEEQKMVFDSSFPEAKVNIHYKPEAECFRDYFEKKARLILVTRDLSAQEKEQCKQLQIFPTSEALASDAVAVVVNNKSTDTVLDVPALKGIITGAYSKPYTVVFDNSASSTVRFMTDSLLKGGKPGSNVFAAKGNQEVIDYVQQNENAIGFVGMSYVYAHEDTSQAGTFINNVKVVAMKNEGNGGFYKPYQAFVALRSYPLSRKLYYVSAESYHGLGTGFANFLGSQRGQLIFLHAHFFPLKAQIVIRDAQVNAPKQ